MILGISASPRKQGSNEMAIKYALRIAERRGHRTNTFFLSGHTVLPCTACGACYKSDTCPQKDDMPGLIKLMDASKAIVVSSPVFFGGMSAQLKAVFDRCIQVRRNGFRLKDKIGAAIATGKSRNGGQETTLAQIHTAMHINAMIVVGDNNHFGGTIVVPFKEDEAGKKTVEDTANKVCDLLERLK